MKCRLSHRASASPLIPLFMGLVSVIPSLISRRVLLTRWPPWRRGRLPRADYFRRFGLFIREGFLDPESCARMRADMQAAPSAAATVWQDGQSVLDEAARNVKWARVQPGTAAPIRERLLALRPELEHHFQVRLQTCQQLQFLVYGEGAFYLPHRDHNMRPDTHPDFPQRKVAAVLFLNGQADQANDD